MQITNVRVKIITTDAEAKLKGFAMVTIDDAIVIRDIRILESERGLYIGMPAKKRDDRFQDIVHPISKSARDQLTTAILDEYKRTITQE